MARPSGGVSIHAFIGAWSDRVFHRGEAPGRQLEPIGPAQLNALKRIARATRFHADNPPPFRTGRQAFLAAQDRRDQATDHLRGLRPQECRPHPPPRSPPGPLSRIRISALTGHCPGTAFAPTSSVRPGSGQASVEARDGRRAV
ncbi:MAG: hypothetical protein ACK4TJ_02695 [Tabrizicola sp.]